MKNAFLCTALGAALYTTAASAQVVINEFSPNPSGQDPDTQTVELLGTPAESFSGTLLSIDSDATDSGFTGTVDRLNVVSGTFDANGLLAVEIGDLENPSVTLVLTGDDATVALDEDLDVDGDGALDSLDSLGSVLDAINVPDSADDALVTYADQLGGTSLAFVGAEPQIAFRETTTGDIYVYVEFEDTLYDSQGMVTDPGGFDLPVGTTTFGAVNPSLTGAPQDTDGDGVADNVDNCTLVANPDQRDTNGDGIGNLCDADLSDNCTISFEDLGLMKSVFFTADPDADLSGNGSVSFEDLGLLKEAFFGPPGPSANGCDAGS